MADEKPNPVSAQVSAPAASKPDKATAKAALSAKAQADAAALAARCETKYATQLKRARACGGHAVNVITNLLADKYERPQDIETDLVDLEFRNNGDRP